MAFVFSHIFYFFRGAEYIVYSFTKGKITGSPKPIGEQFDFYWKSDFDCIVMADNLKAYVFKGSQFIIYDFAAKKRLIGGPVPVRGN